jgi:hypothetical protein
MNIANQGFPAFRSDLNNALSAINSTHSGSSTPSGAVAGTIWLDTTNATNPTLKFYDGSDNISLATIDYSANTVNWLDSSVVADLVNDTSPQLGGDLDLNSNNITGTGNITITGTLTTDQLGIGNHIIEDATVSATASTGTINFDVKTQSVLYFTTNATGNFTLNVRGDGSTTLNSIMSIGDAMTVVFLSTQGGTAYYNNVFQIDGSSVTPKYQGGTAPSEGNANSVDSYVYSIIKTADATFTVFGSQTQFA